MTVINGNPTNFSNLIEPTVFLDWIYRQNTQTNRFVQSGVLKKRSSIRWPIASTRTIS
ncbi:hypothetical protein [Paucilactobacillus hokkaidonensis]|uniref:hypothetical protein n=1 Tax=Paucilactobacillus hokkaidonensis TaxID=1193095 RepID=UPI000B14260E|nr:hypothetical protein [Paucilactobacillus hokkaidonensis]